MKKTIIIALLAIFTAGPVLADGSYRSEPKSKDGKQCKLCSGVKNSGVVKGLKWIVKLPFRVVTATGYGLYELVTDQDFSGFSEGYHVIK